MKRPLVVAVLALLLLAITPEARAQVRGGICHITSATTTVCKAGRGVLGSVVLNTPTAGTVTIYDALTAVAPVLAVITPTVATVTTLTYNIPVGVGITVVTSATIDLTLIYD